MKKISCLLLAGDAASLEPSIQYEQTLVRTAAWELFKISFQEVIAVTGHDSVRVASELEDLPIKAVFNPNHLSGMHSSIRLGLKNLSASYDGVLVCPLLYAGLDYEVLESMILSFEHHEGDKIIFEDLKKGSLQPLLIPRYFVPEIFAHGDGRHGCQYLLKKHLDRSVEMKRQNTSIRNPSRFKSMEYHV